MYSPETYLGKGLKYPLSYRMGNSASSVAEEKVAESLVMLFDTYIGERYMNPLYGSRLRELVFEENNDHFRVMADQYIREAIEQWEKRVETIDKIEFITTQGTDGHEIIIKLTVRLINSQVPFNLVYPFILK